MKVSELIEILSSLPSSSDVVVAGYDHIDDLCINDIVITVATSDQIHDITGANVSAQAVVIGTRWVVTHINDCIAGRTKL